MPQRHRIAPASGALAALLAAVVLTGCREAAQEPDAGPAIEALGGKITRDANLPGKPIISVEFAKVTDAGLRQLAGLKYLSTLKLADTQITDAGLKELAGLKTLTTLDLTGTQVTDAGLKELASLKSLHHVHLTGTRVTDAGVEELQKALRYCDIQH